jgi:hypothetical protein
VPSSNQWIITQPTLRLLIIPPLRRAFCLEQTLAVRSQAAKRLRSLRWVSRMRLGKNALHRVPRVLRDATRHRRVAPQHEGMLLMALRKCLILRCLAKRGLEGRTTFFQLSDVLAQPRMLNPSYRSWTLNHDWV